MSKEIKTLPKTWEDIDKIDNLWERITLKLKWFRVGNTLPESIDYDLDGNDICCRGEDGQSKAN